MKILLGTTNKVKIREIKKIFSLNNIQLVSLEDEIDIPDVDEDGTTFEENSVKKALEIAKHTGMITIADDSGICVEALNGAPGIYSARYAGTPKNEKKNIEKLISKLQGVKNRKAKFISVITLAKPTGETYSFTGEILGEIIDIPRGKGYAYDPYFLIKNINKTLAELPIDTSYSSRTRAVRKLEKKLSNL